MEPHDYEQLNDYLWGRLGPAARSALEARLEVEPDLQEALEQEKILRKAIQSMGDGRLKAALQDEENSLKSEARLRPMWTRLKVAAGILLLAALSFLLYNQLRPTAEPSLFATYFEPFPNLIAPLNRAASPDTDLEKIMADYEGGNYRATIPGLDTLRRADGDPALAFYQGIALLATEQYNAALPLFQTIPLDHRYYWESRWYQALTQLQKGDRVTARTILQSLIEHDGYKADAAKELLAAL